jgi:uncharacterized delta-60 repeat protein
MKSIFTFLVSVLFAYNVTAQPGSLDKGFGKLGVYLDTTIWAFCYTITQQPDGKIITGGYTQDLENPDDLGGLYVARYNIDGSIDENFGVNGKVIIRKVQGVTAFATKTIIVQPDNKILVLGYFAPGNFYSHVGIIRLNQDGLFDSSFGTNGFVLTSISKWSDVLGGMVLQPDGKIVVAGNKEVAPDQPGPDFILRYLPNGSPDESFGNKGQVFTYYTSNVTIGAVALQADGKIVTGEISGTSTRQFQLVRYKSNGFLDSAFGVNGVAILRPQSGFLIELNDLAIQQDKKIVAAGRLSEASMAVARFDSTGKPDPEFGSAEGYTYFNAPDVYAIAKNVFITAKNKILLTGFYSTSDPAKQVAAIQYNQNGTVDSSFGENGVAAGGFSENKYGEDITSGVGLLQSDGKIIVSGSFLQNDENTYNVALFRFEGDLTRKQILITKIRRWLQHHNGIIWDNISGIKSYAVQRSANGVRWTTVNTQTTIINSQPSTVNYYNDALPLPGTNYYRLQTTSVDGVVAYSNVIAINDEPTINLSPNPAKNVLRIEGYHHQTKPGLQLLMLMVM